MIEEQQVGVLGLGLMGSSLCLALRARGYRGRIHAYARRAETREAAVERNMVDAAFDSVGAMMAGTSLAVVCTPVQFLADHVTSCLAGAEAGALITDVGSTKQVLEAAVAGAGSAGVFIGSHPMCGSEKTGLEAGKADLYDGATVAVTGDAGPDTARVEAFWSFVGGVPVVMPADEHDRMVAATSHLPHLAAAMLVQTVGRGGASDPLRRFCATGFRDTTRVAGGSAEMWRGILDTNAPAIAGELEAFRDTLSHWIERMEAGRFDELEELLREAARLRGELVDES